MVGGWAGHRRWFLKYNVRWLLAGPTRYIRLTPGQSETGLPPGAAPDRIPVPLIQVRKPSRGINLLYSSHRLHPVPCHFLSPIPLLRSSEVHHPTGTRNLPYGIFAYVRQFNPHRLRPVSDILVCYGTPRAAKAHCDRQIDNRVQKCLVYKR